MKHLNRLNSLIHEEREEEWGEKDDDNEMFLSVFVLTWLAAIHDDMDNRQVVFKFLCNLMQKLYLYISEFVA
jgi:hypothetical protein